MTIIAHWLHEYALPHNFSFTTVGKIKNFSHYVCSLELQKGKTILAVSQLSPFHLCLKSQNEKHVCYQISAQGILITARETTHLKTGVQQTPK